MPTQVERDAAACGIVKFISVDWEEWHFQSRENPNVYHTVHMSEWGGSGECSCPHFQFRIRPLLVARLVRPGSSAAECKHIARANRVILYRVKKRLFDSH
jgi:hypothetical protein